MRSISWLSLLVISIVVLVGCAPVRSTIQPSQVVRLLSQTSLPATDTAAPTSTPTLAVTETLSLTATQTPLATLAPDRIKETMQPLLQDPMNCKDPCFMGITPGKIGVDEVRAFFSPLGFRHREGTDPNSGREFYSVAYEDSVGRDSSVILFISNNLIDSIEITPEIIKQKEGSARESTTYSPETLIKKYGKPSRVEFALDLGQVNITINVIMYFDTINLIALYSGYEHPRSPRLCPFTYPFDHIRLWMGANPPHPPLFPTISLEKATSLTIDQFTQLMLGEPKNACFTLNWEVFR